MPNSRKQAQTFNDGVANIYSVENIAPPGSMPQEKLNLKFERIRYEERTVGVQRYWTAMQAQARVDMVIRIHRISGISLHDVVAPIDGHQYKIVQIQRPKDDVDIPVIDLSLQRLEVAYDTE